MKEYDLIVVGAGIVGSYFARRCAENGLSVLLLDRRPAEELGAWKNTGHNLDRRVFEELPLAPPSEDEIMARIERAVFKPAVGHPFEFELPMINVRLREFTARVNAEAVAAGVEFRERSRVVGPIVADGWVRGVRIAFGEKTEEIRGRLTADVSGIEAVIRSALPAEMGFPSRLAPSDYLLVYGEDWEIGAGPTPVFTYYPHWQGWSGPRRPGILGLGLGRFAARNEDPRQMFAVFAREAWPPGGRTVWRTFNRVPLRPPLHSFVHNGVLLLGDAACQGKPLNGEGVSVMLFAAETAQESAVHALQREEASQEALWEYNVRFQRDWGARFSVFHRLRFELLCFRPEELDFLFRLELYGPEEISAIMGRVEMSMSAARLWRVLKAAARGISRPDLLFRLGRASLDGLRLKALYQNYPSSPEGLARWREKVDTLYGRSS